jgi:ADP-heptose:LPS heptosyltransferase
MENINKEKQIRTIKVCPGIGDSIWLIQKLINSNERFHFQIPDGNPQRGKSLFDLLPQVAASAEYAPGLSYKKLSRENIQAKRRRWMDIKEQSMYLTANQHLESGMRIEAFLPDLPTSYRLNYMTSEEDHKAAAEILKEERIYIGIYPSAYSNARNAGGWDAAGWFKLIKLLYKKKDICFVIIGAPYDEGITEPLINELALYNIPNINTTGQPLSVVVELLKRLSYFIGFPSGLSIINETLGKDGVMFYQAKDKGIINMWAEPARIQVGNIKECLFCEPEAIYDWIKNDYQLFKKL